MYSRLQLAIIFGYEAGVCLRFHVFESGKEGSVTKGVFDECQPA